MVANAALPNKVLQYLAAGLPVVSTNLRGLATVFDDEDGITWAPSSASVMREAITLITGLTHTSLPSTKKGLEKNLMRFSPQITVDELEGSIKDMLSKLEGL
jgi:glycosyltransferase involved in cell wall biosynthesis